jgi:hypothetical protein
MEFNEQRERIGYFRNYLTSTTIIGNKIEWTKELSDPKFTRIEGNDTVSMQSLVDSQKCAVKEWLALDEWNDLEPIKLFNLKVSVIMDFNPGIDREKVVEFLKSVEKPFTTVNTIMYNTCYTFNVKESIKSLMTSEYINYNCLINRIQRLGNLMTSCPVDMETIAYFSEYIYRIRHDCIHRIFCESSNQEYGKEKSFFDFFGFGSNKTPDLIYEKDGVYIIVEFTVASDLQTAFERKGKDETAKYYPDLLLLKERGLAYKFLEFYYDTKGSNIHNLYSQTEDLIVDNGKMFERMAKVLCCIKELTSKWRREINLYNSSISKPKRNIKTGNLDKLFDRILQLPRGNDEEYYYRDISNAKLSEKCVQQAKDLKKILEQRQQDEKISILYDITKDSFDVVIAEDGLSVSEFVDCLSTPHIFSEKLKIKRGDTRSQVIDLALEDQQVSSAPLTFQTVQCQNCYNPYAEMADIGDDSEDLEDPLLNENITRHLNSNNRIKYLVDQFSKIDTRPTINTILNKYNFLPNNIKDLDDLDRTLKDNSIVTAGLHLSHRSKTMLKITKEDLYNKMSDITKTLQQPKNPFIMHFCTVKPSLDDYRPTLKDLNDIALTTEYKQLGDFTTKALILFSKKYNKMTSVNSRSYKEVVDRFSIEKMQIFRNIKSLLQINKGTKTMRECMNEVKGDYTKLSKFLSAESLTAFEDEISKYRELRNSMSMHYKFNKKSCRTIKVNDRQGYRQELDVTFNREIGYANRGVVWCQDNIEKSNDCINTLSDWLNEVITFEDLPNLVHSHLGDPLTTVEKSMSKGKFKVTKAVACSDFMQDLAVCLFNASSGSLKQGNVYFDNLGRKGVVLLVSGGKSIHTTGFTRMFRLIHKREVSMNEIYPSSSTKLLYGQGYSYIATPWISYNTDLLKHFMNIGCQYRNACLAHDDLFGESFDSLLTIKSMCMLSGKRYLETLLSNLRYVVAGSHNEFNNVLEVIRDKICTETRDIFSLWIIHKIVYNIHEYMNSVCKGENRFIFTGEKIKGLDIGYTSYLTTLMPTAAVNPKTELKIDIKEVLNEHLSIAEDFGLPDNFTSDDYFNATTKDLEEMYSLIRSNGVKNGHYSPEYSFSLGRVLRGVIKSNKLFDPSDEWRRINDRTFTDIANTHGLRTDQPDKENYRGRKGVDVVFGEINKHKEEIDKVVEGFMKEYSKTENKYKIHKVFKENNLTFCQINVSSAADIQLGFYITYKIQKGGSREIYIMHVGTKLRQAPLEKFFAKLCSLMPNELISVSSDKRRGLIHSTLFENESDEEVGYMVLDCTRWGPRSNFLKYVSMIAGCSDVLPDEFNESFFDFFNGMCEKRTFFDSESFKDISLNSPEGKYSFVEEGDSVCSFLHPYSFMMGIFNYLSSLHHSLSQIVTKSIVKKKFGIEMTPSAHSDDSCVQTLHKKLKNETLLQKAKRKNAEMAVCAFILIETGHLANMCYSLKKSSAGFRMLEFLSIYYLDRKLCPVGTKFTDKVVAEYTGDGLIADSMAILSKINEIFRSGASQCACYRIMNQTFSQLYRRYRIYQSQEEIENGKTVPMVMGGIPQLNTMDLVTSGTDSDILNRMVYQQKQLGYLSNCFLMDEFSEETNFCNPISFITIHKYGVNFQKPANFGLTMKLSGLLKRNYMTSYQNFLDQYQSKKFQSAVDGTSSLQAMTNTYRYMNTACYTSKSTGERYTVSSLSSQYVIHNRNGDLEVNGQFIQLYQTLYMRWYLFKRQSKTVNFKNLTLDKSNKPTKPLCGNVKRCQYSMSDECSAIDYVQMVESGSRFLLGMPNYDEKRALSTANILSKLCSDNTSLQVCYSIINKIQKEGQIEINILGKRENERYIPNLQGFYNLIFENYSARYCIYGGSFPPDNVHDSVLGGPMSGDTVLPLRPCQLLHSIACISNTAKIPAKELFNDTTFQNAMCDSEIGYVLYNSLRSLGPTSTTFDLPFFYKVKYTDLITGTKSSVINKKTVIEGRYFGVYFCCVYYSNNLTSVYISQQSDVPAINRGVTEYILWVLQSHSFIYDNIVVQPLRYARSYLVWGKDKVTCNWGWNRTRDCSLYIRTSKMTEDGYPPQQLFQNSYYSYRFHDLDRNAISLYPQLWSDQLEFTDILSESTKSKYNLNIGFYSDTKLWDYSDYLNLSCSEICDAITQSNLVLTENESHKGSLRVYCKDSLVCSYPESRTEYQNHLIQSLSTYDVYKKKYYDKSEDPERHIIESFLKKPPQTWAKSGAQRVKFYSELEKILNKECTTTLTDFIRTWGSSSLTQAALVIGDNKPDMLKTCCNRFFCGPVTAPRDCNYFTNKIGISK